jgi:rhamnosyltransferase
MVSVGVLIPTLNGQETIQECLKPLIASSLRPKILVIDSGSTDGTLEIVKDLGVEVQAIPRSSFGHGKTRERGRQALSCDIFVTLTQDAIAEDVTFLEKLVAPILQKRSSLAYARQVPREGAGFFEAFSRQFFYPKRSEIREQNPFFSNSAAAYCNKALDEVGGFEDVPFGEDTLVASKILKKGLRLAYVAESKVIHSHNFTLFQEFKRHIEIGRVRRKLEQDGALGREYVKKIFVKILKEKPFLIPYGVCHVFCKWLGYKVGLTLDCD